MPILSKVRTLGPFIFSIGDVSGIEGEYIKAKMKTIVSLFCSETALVLCRAVCLRR